MEIMDSLGAHVVFTAVVVAMFAAAIADEHGVAIVMAVISMAMMWAASGR